MSHPNRKFHRLSGTLYVLLSAYQFTQVASNSESAILEDKVCGTLYSGGDFDGDAFTLRDFDQSVNINKDYRAMKQGWSNTKSVRVEAGCRMKLCSESYFQGTCQSVIGEIKEPLHAWILHALAATIRSVNCTCKRVCRCRDIHISKHEYGRAYLKGGCNSCDTEYIDFIDDEYTWSFPKEYKNSVKDIVLRKGCSLSIFSEDEGQGLRADIPSEILEGFAGVLISYKITCNDTEFQSLPEAPRNNSYPEMFDLPTNQSDYLALLSANDTDFDVSQHPGMLMAMQSSQKGRHFRNVYLVLIGDQGYFNSFLASMFPNSEIQEFKENSTGISERRIPIVVDELGISNAQLCIIDVPLGDNANDDVETYYRILASLDEYLSSHSELQGITPNGVIVMHEMHDRNIAGKSTQFGKKLLALQAFKNRLVDERYSNVMLLLQNSNNVTRAEQRNPSSIVSRFEEVIRRELANFPMPIYTATLSYCLFEPKVNGQCRLLSGEYSPKNVHEKLKEICEKSGDALGLTVLKSAFKSEGNEMLMTNVTDITMEMVSKRHSKVDIYRLLSKVQDTTSKPNGGVHIHVHHHQRQSYYSSTSFVSQSHSQHVGFNNRPDLKIKLKIKMKSEDSDKNNLFFKSGQNNDKFKLKYQQPGIGTFSSFQQQQPTNMWSIPSNNNFQPQQQLNILGSNIRNTNNNFYGSTSPLNRGANTQMGWVLPKNTGGSSSSTQTQSMGFSKVKTKVTISNKVRSSRGGRRG